MDAGEEIEVVATAPATPGQTTLDADAVTAFPARTADELLRALPGLHLSAHGGYGKAWQFFLRGFDAVHGSDIAVSLEGIPLNEVSNIHGQGYVDLYFLPTELVTGLDLYTGATRVEAGDFAVAGSAEYHLGRAEEGLEARVGAGTDLSALAAVDWRPRGWGEDTFVHADGSLGEGVGERRAFRQARVAAGIGGDLPGGAHVRAFTLAHDGRFESPGVLRDEDVRETGGGDKGFYGAYPESGGGRSRRVLAGARYARVAGLGRADVLVYGQARSLALQHNFTGYLLDGDHGDARLQTHDAATAGVDVRYRHALPTLTLDGSAVGRLDVVHQVETRVETDGTPWQQTIDADLTLLDLSAWAAAEWRPSRWLTLTPGIRGEHLRIGLVRHVDEAGAIADPEPALATAWVPLPKAGAAVHLSERVDVHARWGRGFRSPEARGIEGAGEGGTDPAGVAPVERADTSEVGARWAPTDTVELRIAGFHTWVSNEIVFDHLAGRFAASGTTRRLGGEVVGTWRPIDALRTEAQATYADGRYVATGALIPYAPRLLLAGGVYVEGVPLGKLRTWAGLHGWYLGPRPLPEGFSSHPSFVLDLTARVEARRWLVALSVDNVLATHTRDGEFVYPSWFDRDAPRSELPVPHFTAGEPFAVRAELGVRL